MSSNHLDRVYLNQLSKEQLIALVEQLMLRSEELQKSVDELRIENTRLQGKLPRKRDKARKSPRTKQSDINSIEGDQKGVRDLASRSIDSGEDHVITKTKVVGSQEFIQAITRSIRRKSPLYDTLEDTF